MILNLAIGNYFYFHIQDKKTSIELDFDIDIKRCHTIKKLCGVVCISYSNNSPIMTCIICCAVCVYDKYIICSMLNQIINT